MEMAKTGGQLWDRPGGQKLIWQKNTRKSRDSLPFAADFR
jgi:hypothetical protein